MNADLLATIARYDLRVTVYFDRFDRMWHAVVTADSCPGLDQADENGDHAVRAALSRFVLEMKPREAGT